MLSACPVTGATEAPTNNSGCPFTASKSATKPLGDPLLAIPQQYRGVDLTPEQRSLVKASVPALQAHGFDITKVFYSNLLNENPSLNDTFNISNQITLEQPKALAGAVLAYAQNIDDLTPLLGAVDLIASKHASLYVQPDRYAIVGSTLINAIAAVLGDAVTPELAEAWTVAYWKLSAILISVEHQLYLKNQNWVEWQDFKIVKKVIESDEITSFYLEPVSDSLKPLPEYTPGQFISIQVDVPELKHKQTRQYSLSDCSHPDHYRISIKRETGQHNGLISNLMHDTKNVGDVISVSQPQGTFILDSKMPSEAPLVLISGGVGLTPLTAMLNSETTVKSTRPITWIHGARSSAVRPFKEQFTETAKNNSTLNMTLFTDTIKDGEIEGVDYHFKGPVDLSRINKEKLFLDNDKTEYFLCGPAGFMKTIMKALIDLGVDESKVHVEKFGTGMVAFD